MTFGQRNTRPSGRGFTLIELLVVIAIIALLIGILLPALSAAQTIATVGRCLGNEHQMGIGVAAYESDNNGALPGIQALEGGDLRVNGELGVSYGALYDPPEHDGAYIGGWGHGALIYATLEQSDASGSTFAGNYPFSNAELAAAPFGNLDAFDGVTGWDWGSTSPSYSANSTAYSKPVGLGYVGQYLSPYGTMDGVDGRLFYCPGSPASFGIPFYMGDQFWAGSAYSIPSSILFPRNNFGANGLYSTFLSDWNQKPGAGGGSAGTAPFPNIGATDTRYQQHAVNPFVYSTYIYRSNEYYDYVDANGAVHQNTSTNDGYGPGVSIYHDNDTSYPKSDATFLSGECFMVCNSLYAGAVSDSDQIRERSFGDVCHTGTMVNRAFHDGSASTYTVPTGHLPPCDDTHLGYGHCVGPAGYTGTLFYQGLIDDSPGAPGLMPAHFATWPYYWVVLDNKAPIPPTN